MTSAFGAAVRAWRDRLSAADTGLPTTARRRAAGLRREELASLAGLSVDYVVRLEQGHARNPSAHVVAALARALQLDNAERDHLYRTAGLLPPAAGDVSTHIPPGVARIVARLGDVPLAVFSADWTLLTWTPLWASLFGDPAVVAPEERNLLRVLFLPGASPAWRRVAPDGVSAALPAALVADLRTTAAAHPHDRRLAALVAALHSASRDFAALWDSGAVAAHESERKTVAHPAVGPVTLDCDVLTAHGSDLRVVVYTAPAGSPDADKLDLLRVTGATAINDQGTALRRRTVG
ncbi:helix-turn-helix transcriptional regulator [Verrucosispora sp. WMMC514]|uniref:helix-turn-helix domain-containing protein n=1 Tax=Verrucosispora sp. WMMC514 TaxID=3015156 RepID=UPI00248D2210|nr:helix-turn-helix transcriptional regulator [Verrucosispora sp. WMMC514]WBB90966.1 helix-turn-helix transcriptional regulator [Verrucosispora sp. WMMC514]